MEKTNVSSKNVDFSKESDYIERAKIFLNENKYEEAKAELKKALAINPYNEQAFFEIGNIHLRLKDDAHAEEEYKKVLEVNPRFFYAGLELGKLYHYRMKRPELAIAEFNRVIAEYPDNWEAHFELGLIDKEKGNYATATEKLQKASDLNLGCNRVHFELGKLYRDMNRPDEAIKEFDKVLAMPANANDTFIKNKALNEIEITQKKIILESKVRAMVAMILNKCNLSCIMCHIWESSWQASEKTMDEIVKLFPYVEDMVWEGGEVLLMRGFDDIMKEACYHKHLKQTLFTNGLVLNENVIEKIIHSRIDIVFSIDGVTKDTYEHIRRGGKLTQLLRNLTLIKNAKEVSRGKIETYFNSIVMKSNHREIEKFIDFAKEYNFNAITLTPLRGEFGDENIFEQNNTQALEFLRKVMPEVAKKAKAYGIILNNWLPNIQCNDSKAEECAGGSAQEKCRGNYCSQEKGRLICHAPWQRLVLDSEGQVRPFVFCMNKWVGNSDKNSLEEIWNGEAMQEYRRRIISYDYQGLCQPECISGQVADKIRDIA